jgi:hypothetical protein
MGLVELSVTLHVTHERLIPEARAWVDLEPDGDLHSEIELPLHRHGLWRWIGVMGVADPTPECFFYRLGIVGHAGAQWSIKVRDRNLGRDILVDTDTLTSAKCWLIGSCPLSPATMHGERGPTAVPAMPTDASVLGGWTKASSRRKSETNVVFLAHRRPK